MGQMGDLIGTEGAAATGVLGPAEHPGLEEGAIHDQLRAALEQIEQAYLALGSVELVLLLNYHPRHSSTLGGQRITGTGQGLLFYEELLPRSLPLLLRHDRGCLYRDLPSQALVSVFAFHIRSPLLSETTLDLSSRSVKCARTEMSRRERPMLTVSAFICRVWPLSSPVVTSRRSSVSLFMTSCFVAMYEY